MRMLRELLSRQVEQYRQMEQLEVELTGLVEEKTFAKITENTRRKSALMEQIIAADAEITPVILAHQDTAGSLPDADAEELRGKAVAMLERLQELETKNRTALEEFRDTMTRSFRQTKQAKRAAHGYKQSKSIYRSKHDSRG